MPLQRALLRQFGDYTIVRVMDCTLDGTIQSTWVELELATGAVLTYGSVDEAEAEAFIRTELQGPRGK